MKPITVLFNPSSGGGISQKKKIRLQQKFSDAGIESRFVESESEIHLRELVRESASRWDGLVGIGGDTTFSIIAQELVKIKRTGEKIPVLGMVGTGSANDIVRGLGMVNMSSLINSIHQWHVRKMDVGEIKSEKGSRVFMGTVSAGIGIAVNRYLESWTGRHPFLRRIKFLHQVLTGIAGIRHAFKQNVIPRTVHISWDAGEGAFDFSLLAFLNIPYYAGGMRLSPSGSPFSGLLDCCIVETGSVGSTLMTGLRINLGFPGDHPRIKRISSADFTVQFSQESDIQYDGDPVYGIGRLHISVLPKYLDVFVPTGS